MNKPAPVVGYEFEHTFRFSQHDVIKFAEVTGDRNPVHLDPNYAASTPFGKPIMHGFLSGSIFSKVFGTIFPGEGTIYLEQQMVFKKPMFVDVAYTARFKIEELDPARGLIRVACTVEGEDKQTCILGFARLMNKSVF